jgi:hypothetical protein
MESNATIEVPVGRLTVTARSESGSARTAAVDLTQHGLPLDVGAGTAVEGRIAVLVALPRESEGPIEVEAHFIPSAPVRSGPCSGQGLDALSFESDRSIAILGTEDADELARRSSSNSDEPHPVVVYGEHKLTIRISPRALARLTSVHFILAWGASSDAMDYACWCAVDTPHAAVRAAGTRP